MYYFNNYSLWRSQIDLNRFLAGEILKLQKDIKKLKTLINKFSKDDKRRIHKK